METRRNSMCSSMQLSRIRNARPLGVIAATLAVMLLTVLSPGFAFPQVVVVDVEAVAMGYRASELIGRPVRNDDNERIGTIDDLVVDRERVLYAVVEVGGFLGIGDHLIAVPYEALQLNADGTRIVLPGATREELERLPGFHYK